MRKFGLGAAVKRVEDVRLLTGGGRFTGDIRLADMVEAVVLRSPHAHASIKRIETAPALALPGVHAIITGADLARDGLDEVPCMVPVADREGRLLPRPGRPLLARGRVRFVGEPVAFVVADTLDQARVAGRAVQVDYRPLPAAVMMADALAEGALQLWPGADGNRAFYWERGDGAAVAAGLAGAAHMVRLDLVNNRVVPCTMEPRAVLAEYDEASGRFTLTTSSQGAHGVKNTLARYTLKVPAEQIRVVVPDVGGGFGTKAFHYPEEAVALWAARRLGRPVRWQADRRDAFVGDTHGRDQANAVCAGFDADGRFTALRVDTHANMGAYLNAFAPAVPSQMTGCMLSGAYRIPAIFATCTGVYTNTVPVDAYRGAGRPEAAYVLERLMDAAARQLGLAPDDIRRRNFVPPAAMPYASPMGPTYDSGDFARNLDDALKAADWEGFAERRAQAQARGRLRGIGLSSYIEICGFDAETVHLRFREDDRIEVLIGTQSNGQGHETAYAQVVCDALAVPFEAVRVIQGDTDLIPTGKGTGGSRSLPVGGPAIQDACANVIARGRRFAARLLQVPETSVSYGEGLFTVGGTARDIGLFDLARAARDPENRPPNEDQAGLDGEGHYRMRDSTFPNGCHVCEVEVDPETGAVEVVAYHVVDDFGTIVNPMLLAGQIQGGVAQGIGQALLEEAVYDRTTGALLSDSFQDYAVPRAQDLPWIEPRFNVVPCRTNPLGIKGAGEAGAIAAAPAVINAILDALAPLGVSHVDMPATPEKVWRAIEAARLSHKEHVQ